MKQLPIPKAFKPHLRMSKGYWQVKWMDWEWTPKGYIWEPHKTSWWYSWRAAWNEYQRIST